MHLVSASVCGKRVPMLMDPACVLHDTAAQAYNACYCCTSVLWSGVPVLLHELSCLTGRVCRCST